MAFFLSVICAIHDNKQRGLIKSDHIQLLQNEALFTGNHLNDANVLKSLVLGEFMTNYERYHIYVSRYYDIYCTELERFKECVPSDSQFCKILTLGVILLSA